MVTFTNDLTRLPNAHEYSRQNTLRPPWQDFSALNFDISGFTGVVIVVLNTVLSAAALARDWPTRWESLHATFLLTSEIAGRNSKL